SACTRDECDGSGSCVHPPGNAGVVCRVPAGPCDVAERCTGVDPACPADGFASSSTTCSGSSQGGACDDDASDHCSGTGNACVDAFRSTMTVCRASTGQCDVAETCTGSGGACPVDAFASSSTFCTGSSQHGWCDDDAADHCAGTVNRCVDAFRSSGTVCRPSRGDCDVAENCTGSNGACPPDTFVSIGTLCGSSADTVCTAPDSCDGSGTCVANDAPDGTGCDDADVCTQVDQCENGICTGRSSLDCDDGSFCTHDSCDPVAGCQHDAALAAGCKTALKSSIFMKRASDPKRNQLVWKWQHGQQTDFSELGDPTIATTYGLCVYDASDTLIADLILPADSALWSAWGKSGFKYRDRTLRNGGAQSAFVAAGVDGHAKAQIQGRGSALDDPPLGALALPLTVQFRNDTRSACFQNRFDTGDVVRDDA